MLTQHERDMWGRVKNGFILALSSNSCKTVPYLVRYLPDCWHCEAEQWTQFRALATKRSNVWTLNKPCCQLPFLQRTNGYWLPRWTGLGKKSKMNKKHNHFHHASIHTSESAGFTARIAGNWSCRMCYGHLRPFQFGKHHLNSARFFICIFLYHRQASFSSFRPTNGL